MTQPHAVFVIRFNEKTVTENTYIIIATRGHRYDLVATQAAVSTDAKYIGLVGSMRKAILVFEELLKEGVSEDRVKSIRSPVGLDLRGRSPDEIAVSIVAEMLMIREGGSGLPMTMPDNIWTKITLLSVLEHINISKNNWIKRMMKMADKSWE